MNYRTIFGGVVTLLLASAAILEPSKPPAKPTSTTSTLPSKVTTSSASISPTANSVSQLR